MISLIWSKFIGYVVAVLGIVAMVLAWRYKISKGAREKLENQIKDRTIERVQHAREVEAELTGVSDDTIIDKLRDNGWIRD